MLSLIKAEIKVFIFACLLIWRKYFDQVGPDMELGVKVCETDIHQEIGSLDNV